jgi:hypothetical protein
MTLRFSACGLRGEPGGRGDRAAGDRTAEFLPQAIAAEIDSMIVASPSSSYPPSSDELPSPGVPAQKDASRFPAGEQSTTGTRPGSSRLGEHTTTGRTGEGVRGGVRGASGGRRTKEDPPSGAAPRSDSAQVPALLAVLGGAGSGVRHGRALGAPPPADPSSSVP